MNTSRDFLPKGVVRGPLVHINEIDGTVTFKEYLQDLRGLDRPNHCSEETYPTSPYKSDKTEKLTPSLELNTGPSTYMLNALNTELLGWAGNVTQIDICPFLPHFKCISVVLRIRIYIYRHIYIYNKPEGATLIFTWCSFI